MKRTTCIVPELPGLFDSVAAAPVVTRERRALGPAALPHKASASGLRLARRREPGRQHQALAYLRRHGAATDHELAEALGLPLASVNSLRHGLVRRGLVAAYGLERGPCGALRTRWRLTHGVP